MHASAHGAGSPDHDYLGIISGRCSCEGEWSFYTLRFLLGVAEPASSRNHSVLPIGIRPRAGRRCGLFMLAVRCNIAGGLFSGWIMRAFDTLQAARMEMLFILEAVPSVVMALVVWTTWLTTFASAVGSRKTKRFSWKETSRTIPGRW